MSEDMKTPEEQLSQLFGGYKAEWLKGQLFELFTKPNYFPELETSRPCVLIGGRGTGKTTALLGLSYEGQFALRGKRSNEIQTWPYYGFYYRVNTNRVTAFRGPELEDSQWVLLFAHYFNLLLCELVFKFLDWYQVHSGSLIELPHAALMKVATSFNSADLNSLRELSNTVAISRTRFEAYVNNVLDGDRPPLSMQGAPIDNLMEALHTLPQFSNKNFFFLLDEYENFEPYQQRVANTLIKHCGELYTFKIGVKELGLRERATLNENEQIISPADYERISIADKLEGDTFATFAEDVCNERIAKISASSEILRRVRVMLPGLGEDEEAKELGIAPLVEATKGTLKRQTTVEIDVLDSLPERYVYLFRFWSQGKNIAIEEVWRDFLDNREEWDTRYENYKHALLYTIRRGKRGIQKYYAGWDVFTRLAASNIRYLLEVVDQSLLLHLKHGGDLSTPVPFKLQTEAAQTIGKKNLSELEGLSVRGAQLTKLLLGLGRVFQVMAADAYGHAPEVNQFHLSDQNGGGDIDELLQSAVMHLALIRSLGNKLADEGDTKEYDYMIHPIYSPLFNFSYRRKRKMMLTTSQVLGLVKAPKSTIREILAQSNRVIATEEPLPDQLQLFERYYRADS